MLNAPCRVKYFGKRLIIGGISIKVVFALAFRNSIGEIGVLFVIGKNKFVPALQGTTGAMKVPQESRPRHSLHEVKYLHT
jgi:hypothetical protein